MNMPGVARSYWCRARVSLTMPRLGLVWGLHWHMWDELAGHRNTAKDVLEKIAKVGSNDEDSAPIVPVFTWRDCGI